MKTFWIHRLATLIVLGTVWVGEPAQANDAGQALAEDANMHAAAKRIVSRYKAVMDAPPRGIPSRNVVGGPLLGNGSLGVVLNATPDAWPLQFWTCKSSFSKLRHDHRKGGPRPFGTLDLSIPALKGGTWHSEQDIYSGITTCSFTRDAASVSVRTFVAATEDLLIIELTNDGKTPVAGEYRSWVAPGTGSQQKTFEKTDDPRGKVICATKAFPSGIDGGLLPAEIPTAAACAVKTVGRQDTGFTLAPGDKVTLALAMKSAFDERDPMATVQKMVLELTDERIAALEQEHRDWWRTFWAKSLIEIGDSKLEKEYYLYNYQVGSSLRDKVFPPGLFGLWTTDDDPNWCGDYHLNFDYQSQYWSLYKNNYIEQAECFQQPILDFMERGRWYAKHVLGCQGVYYPVGIWAKGMDSSRQLTRGNAGGNIELGGVFMGQKCNTGYSVVNMSMHWFHTYDLHYAKTVYPFVVEVANFWQDYLRFEPFTKTEDGALVVTPPAENFKVRPPVGMIKGVPIDEIPVRDLPAGRYVIYDSAIQESCLGDLNNPMDLGMVHTIFTLALDMSKGLGVDADRHEKWQHIIDNLSTFPTFEKDGKTVFRYSEMGTEWLEGNSVGLHHIYPTGALGPDDDPKLIEIARNMLDANGRPWFNDNGLNSHYPAAVRMGYDPEVLLQRLRGQGGMANGFQGSIESSTLPNTLNEMLCMSHRQVLRVFHVWPKTRNARFWTLRAEGAFLVSSELKDGRVRYIRIKSEKGRDCTFVNPWPGQDVDVYRDRKKVDTLQGADRITLKTTAGESVVLGPGGEGYPTDG